MSRAAPARPCDHTLLAGSPAPLGATVSAEGVNFSIYSTHADAVELLLFDRYDQSAPSQVLPLDPEANRTYYYWHAYVSGLQAGALYAYRVHGPYLPEEGLLFSPAKALLDPYSAVVAYGSNWRRAEAQGLHDNVQSALKAMVVDYGPYDWEGDAPLQRPVRESVIYEAHVRGFTRHPSSGVRCPGTYRGLIEKIPYLQRLGITAIELLPVQQFDPQEVNRRDPLTGAPLSNYWGYAPVAFFAPHQGYACEPGSHAVVDEFRDMVKALHRAGIEVILDVVFNHTGEGNENGPTISFRGLENGTYYILSPEHCGYLDFTGCANTVNANHSIVRRMIRDCLRHWVQVYHVDGFRFDLASALSRDTQGQPLDNPPILWEIESDPVLAGTKLIAEAWDASGLYQLGGFTGDRWAEWNGRFRDDVRRFFRGDPGTARDLAWRLTGSFDLFRGKASYTSHRSINYVTAHDGFTLADLVSYSRKHNLANGEDNRDGTDYNHSWNCGTEGPTNDPEILNLRARQMRNMLTALMIARGTPMILGGDEFARTQAGNNNAYCQDNETSWHNWSLAEERADLVRFVRLLVALRQRHPTLTKEHRMDGRPYDAMLYDGVLFHGVHISQPDWGYHSHSLAMQLQALRGDTGLYAIMNAYHEPLEFELPSESRWRRLIDTALASPEDIVENESEGPVLADPRYRAAPHSMVVLGEVPPLSPQSP
ncbi:MAG: glycogen debranching protein GlgX [Chloroflexi bacterium]|nr:glycogen debranching protein GlgX [Chloroflexota bacterium]